MIDKSTIALRRGEQPPGYPDLQPGDVFWDPGGGIVGWGIRLFTGGAHAHTGVLVDWPDKRGRWSAVEAYPGGVKLRDDRDGHRITGAMRFWRDESERQAIVDAALGYVGLRYGYGEIVAIALNRIGVPVSWPDSPKAAICSNVSCGAICAARPELSWRPTSDAGGGFGATFSRPPHKIWPALLWYEGARFQWIDARRDEREGV